MYYYYYCYCYYYYYDYYYYYYYYYCMFGGGGRARLGSVALGGRALAASRPQRVRMSVQSCPGHPSAGQNAKRRVRTDDISHSTASYVGVGLRSAVQPCWISFVCWHALIHRRAVAISCLSWLVRLLS